MIDLNREHHSREIRIFVSSTFRDMQKERNFLVKAVFPKLRKFCHVRGVELVEVDLRWGVTEEDAQQGRVIEVCLREIDRCRPYFIGLIGHRYGWVPGVEDIERHRLVFKDYPWVREDLEKGLSITEIEMQYGVLRNPGMSAQSFFYLRDEASTPLEFREEPGSDASAKLERLRAAITGQSACPHHDFHNLAELEDQVTRDFISFIEREFPESEKPSPMQQARMDHASFASSRLKVYIGGEKYLKRVNEHVEDRGKPMVVTGPQGCGKTALLANWIAHRQKSHPDEFIIYHFVGGAPESGDHFQLMRRVMEEIRECFSLDLEIPDDDNKLADSFPFFLASAPHGQRMILVLDALDQLEEKGNALWLGWFPEFVPDYVRIVVSARPGPGLEELERRGCPTLEVLPLSMDERKMLIREYFRCYTKTLPGTLVEEIAADCESKNPLLLRTVLDELRIFGIHESLSEMIRYYISTDSPAEFFNAVLKRYEQDYEKQRPGMVGKMLSLIWSSRRGLSEPELLGATGTPALFWNLLYNAMDSHLVNRRGLLDFSHDYLRQAVEKRYLHLDETRKAACAELARHFLGDPLSPRALDEIPLLLLKAEQWEQLKDYIGNVDFLKEFDTGARKYELMSYWKALGSRYSMVDAYMDSLERLEERAGHEEEIASRINSVARFFSLTSYYNEAELLYRRALAIRERMLGPEHIDTAVSLNGLAILLNKKADYKNAEPLHRRALAIREKVLGAEHPDTAMSLNSVAYTMSRQGDSEQAEILYRKALDTRRKVLGPDHPDIAMSLNNLAYLMSNKGNYEEAENLYRQALTIKQKAYGQEYPSTALTMNNLAYVLNKKGDHEGAEALYRQALAIRERFLGPDHPATALVLYNLASIYSSRGDFDDAEQLYRRALAIREKALGHSHPDTVKVMNKLNAINSTTSGHS